MDNLYVTVSLKEFYEMLEKHDWYYAWSDDVRVYDRGMLSYGRLAKVAEQSDKHRELLKAYADHMFSGKPWNTVQTPKPEKPVDPKTEKQIEEG